MEYCSKSMNPIGLMSKREYHYYMLGFGFKKTIQNGNYNECDEYIPAGYWKRLAWLPPLPRGWENVLNI